MYGASRLWVDAVIDPRETRRMLAHALEAVSNNSEIEPLRTGVLQT